jgi:hypothetical protein
VTIKEELRMALVDRRVVLAWEVLLENLAQVQLELELRLPGGISAGTFGNN